MGIAFCYENPDECLSGLRLGYKLFVLLLNLGFVVPYTPFREALGWFALVIIISLFASGLYFLSSLIWRDLFAKRKDLHLPLKQRDIELPFFDSSTVGSETDLVRSKKIYVV